MKLRAVLTGDIIDSNRLEESEYEAVMKRLDDELAKLEKAEDIARSEIYRGDAFQAYIRDVGKGLPVLFKIRTSINSLKPSRHKRGQQPAYNIRLSLGVGFMSTEPGSLRTTEPPFVFSGRGLDEIIDKNATIAVKTEDDYTNQELETEFYLLEYILQKWTPTAADIIHKKLNGYTEREIAEELEISQSAVNQHSRQACWNGFERMIIRYRRITRKLKATVDD